MRPLYAVDPAQLVGGSPTSDQAPAADAAATPLATGAAPIVDVKALQQGYTQATQQNAAIRNELGLPQEATTQDLLGAIAGRGKPATDDDDRYALDPELVARRQSREDRGWAAAEKVCGPATPTTWPN
jgi:hypothetical protein